MAVAGNIVTIAIFRKRQLRKRPHFLLISLAAADLLVGLLTIPLYVVTLQYHLHESQWLLAIVNWMDMFTGLTSIFTLAAISLERTYAIGWPFRHRTLSSRTYAFAIGIPWILALIAASTEIVLQFVFIQPVAFVSLLFVYLSTPVVVTCSAYFVLWKKESSRIHLRQVQEARDLKLTKTTSLITGAFLVTWLPVEIVFLVFNLCISCQDVSPVTVYIVKFLQFANSVINMVIYPARIVEYRTALVELSSSYKCSCRIFQVGLSENVGASVISQEPLGQRTDRLSESQQTSRI